MTIDDFKGLMDGFEPASLLPELDSVLGNLAMCARIAVLIGPAALLVMGLLYFFASPKEANYHFGYRCYYGMGSVAAWQFTQSLSGIVWVALGLIFGIVMLLVSASFPQLETMDLLWKAVYCVAWEAGITALACIGINTVVAVRYDSKGNLRRKKRHT